MSRRIVRPAGQRSKVIAGLLSGAALVAAGTVVAAVPSQAAVAVRGTAPFASVSSVACSSKTDCVAVGNATYNTDTGASTAGALYSTDGGAKWSVGKVPSGYIGIYGVDCVSSTTCYAVAAKSSGAGALLTTTNASAKSGPTWKTSALPNVSGTVFSAPNAISCPATSRCYIAGTSNGGADPAVVQVSISGSKISLSAAPLPAEETGQDYPGVLYAISCSSETFCVTVGGNAADQGGGFLFANGHWALITSFSSSLPTLWTVDCVAKSSDCYAGDASTVNNTGSIVRSTNNGSSWKSVSVPSGTGAVYDLSCTTTTRCAMAGNTTGYSAEVATTTTGTKFTAVKVPNGRGPMYGIDCESSTLCIAGGSNSAGTGAQLLYTTTFTTWKPSTIS